MGQTQREWARLMRRVAVAALPRYGLEGARLALLGQAVNTVFRVDVAPGPHTLRDAAGGGATRRFVLRIYRPASAGYVANLDTAALRSELIWLRALRHEAGLVVPDPVSALDSATLTEVRMDEGPEVWRCVLSHWTPGRHHSAGLTPARLRRVGRFMGRMHRHAERFVAPPSFTRPRWDWGRLFGAASVLAEDNRDRLSAPGDRAAFAALAERARSDMEALGEGSEVFGLIHSDLHQGNYLFQGDEAHAIDFEECGFGYYLFDMAVTLYALERREDYAARRAAFLAGYRAERPLADRDEQLLGLFRALRVVDLANWVLSWPSPDDHPWGRDYLAEAPGVIRAFLGE